MILVSSEVFEFDLWEWARYLWDDRWACGAFLANGGEHYQLLAYLASKLPSESVAVDVGTAEGASALALRAGGVKVFSFDVKPTMLMPLRTFPGITFKVADGVESALSLLDARLIVLDINPHEGEREFEMVRRLDEARWKGLLVCDDIHLTPSMDAFWESVRESKWDVTKYGHFTGTGIVGFGGESVTVL